MNAVKFLSQYRRIGAVLILLIPQLAALAGYPIAGEDVAAIVNGFAAAAASGLIVWSKIASQKP